MRRAPALLAAAALLLALGAPACQPSSLTPFGIGTREPEDPAQNINGTWEGLNDDGLPVAFQVGDDRVLGLSLQHDGGACIWEFTATSNEAVVEDGAFALEIFLNQGRVVISGVFTTGSTCSGSYFFEGLPLAENCETAGAGTFIAGKTTR